MVRGNYVWCLVIFIIFMGSGGAKRWRDALKLSFGVANVSHKGEVGNCNREVGGGGGIPTM